MNRRSVKSSNVAGVGWAADEANPAEGTLEVEFISGHVYQYKGVPQLVYQNLLGASSVGRTMNTDIIGRYDEQRIS